MGGRVLLPGMLMKPAGTRITLRESVRPDASYANPGDVLQTITGRRYEVLAVDGRNIRVRIMAAREALPADARVGTWSLNAKRKAWKAGDNPLPFTEGTGLC